MTQEHPIPHDDSSEEAVIGSLLVDGETINDVVTVIKPDDFFFERNKWIYQACLSLHKRSEGINEVTVARELAHDEKLETVGGAAYLSHLISICPTSRHAEYYAGIVNRLAIHRRLITAGGEITRLGFQADADVDLTLAKAARSVAEVQKLSPTKDLLSPKDLEAMAQKRYDGLRHKAGCIANYGIAAIDKQLGGMYPGNLIIIGAETSRGKTELMLSCARSIQESGIVLFASIEMSPEDIIDRNAVSLSNLPIHIVRGGNYDDEEMDKLSQAAGEHGQMNLWLLDSPEATTDLIQSRAIKLQSEAGLLAMFVDYLQILHDKPSDTAYNRMSYIVRRLRAIARTLKVPVIVGCQFNRGVNQRYNKEHDENVTRKPHVSDLRDSSEIEHAADVILLMYRDYAIAGGQTFDTRVIVGKNRQGDSGQDMKIDWNQAKRCYE